MRSAPCPAHQWRWTRPRFRRYDGRRKCGQRRRPEPSDMVETSPSLLDRLSRRPEDGDWGRLVSLYTPVLHAWLGRHGLQTSDRDDLTQEVLGVVVQKLPEFRHNGRAGAFRS